LTGTFYKGYLCRTFGSDALEETSKTYEVFEENELAMGLHSTLVGFQGMNNFCNYADSYPIRAIGQLRANPFTRTAAPDRTAYCVRWHKGFIQRENHVAFESLLELCGDFRGDGAAYGGNVASPGADARQGRPGTSGDRGRPRCQ
jgi:hypothetical protein